MTTLEQPLSAAVIPAVVDPTAVTDRNGLPKLKFAAGDRFLRELRGRVDAYFERTGKRRRDCPSMYAKTGVMMTWFFGTYVLLLTLPHHWWIVLPLAVLQGMAVACIGFNVQHDGGHKAYSDRPWVNRLMAKSLDLMGASSYVWDFKHNAFHHTYTNISDHDDDIDVGFLGRMSPNQPRLPFHRFQGIYMWFLYGLLAVKWQLFDDYYNIAIGRLGHHKLPRPKGRQLVEFIAGKAVFLCMVFVLPMLLLHTVWPVIGVYLIAAFVSGVTMSVVFQLAHVVEEAQFPVPVADGPGHVHIERPWAEHQIETTVDFARGNWLLCYFLGGLNFQVEHHLFHKICHVHYPALSKVVEDACKEFGIQYNAHKSFWAAVASHGRHLAELGRPTPMA